VAAAASTAAAAAERGAEAGRGLLAQGAEWPTRIQDGADSQRRSTPR